MSEETKEKPKFWPVVRAKIKSFFAWLYAVAKANAVADPWGTLGWWFFGVLCGAGGIALWQLVS